jgi:hypothetical protein
MIEGNCIFDSDTQVHKVLVWRRSLSKRRLDGSPMFFHAMLSSRLL